MKLANRNTTIPFKRRMTLGFTGVAGFHFWDGSSPKEDGTYHTELWKNTFRAQNHMNGDDVIKTLSNTWGGWGHGMGKAENYGSFNSWYSVEHQYYISSDKSNAVGYVKNRSFNLKTRSSYGTLCYNKDFGSINNSPRNTEWNDVKSGDRLKVASLKPNTEYKVEWYSIFSEGNNGYIKTDCIESYDLAPPIGIGAIVLRYPELTVSHSGSNDLPAVWYVMYEQSCNSGMAQKNNINESREDFNEKELLNNKGNVQNSLKVYPNPFNNNISIQSLQKDQLILKSIEGKVIDSYEIEKGQSRVNTANLSSGMYILTFINQNESFKLIKR